MNEQASGSLPCSNCGTALRTGAAFCNACGAPAERPSQREWIVGSAAECAIVVANATVSRRHCRLVSVDSGYLIEDLGSRNGTFVNGTRITGPVRIAPTDRVTLGQNQPLPWPNEAQATTLGARGDSSGQSTPDHRTATAIRIGRDVDNDVVLDFPMVSGHHARIVFEDGKAVILDLGSTNGLAIGAPGKRVTRAIVCEDDAVYFGSLRVPVARLLNKKGMNAATPARISLARDSITIGRDPACDHVLDYPMISARHSRIFRTDGTTFVEDLGSTNGTFVNGRRITRAVRSGRAT